jgi:hypothetical protein
MTTITPGAVFGVNAPFNVSPSYSGTFIPTLWSAKLNAKFYAASVFAAITNTDWEGDISGLGDKVIINNIPDIAISDYTIGTSLSYQAPTPSTLELVIDKGKAFAFQVSDVLAYQSKLDMMDVFSNDASEQIKVAVDKQVLTGTFSNGASANKGATAGVKSGAFNMGTDTAPVTLTAANVLQKILEMASVLDEQNVPETDRFVVLDPLTRTLLLQSNIAQAQFMGDPTSPVRNGLIGRIDRFDVYVSNQLPTAAAGLSFPDIYGNTTSVSGALKRRAIMAGHRTAMCFASQMTKTETLRNPTDFGDLVRGLQVYGYKVVKPESLALLIAA